MMYRTRSVLFIFLMLALSGCGDTARHVDLTLDDGTHVGGLLVSVEPDWLVLDRSTSHDEPDIMLVDYSIVDTVTIADEMSVAQESGISLLGAAAGGLIGYWAGEGYLPDSTRPADPKRSTRATVSSIAGIAVGGLLTYLVTNELGKSTVVFSDPTDDDYDSISSYAKYPDGLPSELRMALDSGWEWTTKNETN